MMSYMTLSLNKSQSDPAKEIYDALIKRIRVKIRANTSIVFDPETGIQKCFLHGKLLWIKHVRGINKS